MTTAYPLAWPPGWPRTPPAEVVEGKYQFRRTGHYSGNPFWTFGAARDALLLELQRLGAENVVLSTNFRVRSHGLPSDNDRRPQDQGIAVYFMLNGKPLAMARDYYVRAEENMRSLTLVIEAMRTIERHGGDRMMSRAFDGFTALPAPERAAHWSEILGVKQSATRDEIERAYREKAKRAHPDTGGTHDSMTRLSRARDEALREKV